MPATPPQPGANHPSHPVRPTIPRFRGRTEPTAKDVRDLPRHERCTVLVADRQYYCIPHSRVASRPGPHVVRVGDRWVAFHWDADDGRVVTRSPDGYLPVRQYTVFWFVFQYYVPQGRVFECLTNVTSESHA